MEAGRLVIEQIGSHDLQNHQDAADWETGLRFIPSMPYDDALARLASQADAVAFAGRSLSFNQKVYDYIGLNIPIIGFVPESHPVSRELDSTFDGFVRVTDRDAFERVMAALVRQELFKLTDDPWLVDRYHRDEQGGVFAKYVCRLA